MVSKRNVKTRKQPKVRFHRPKKRMEGLEEPEFSGLVRDGHELIRAFNFYNYLDLIGKQDIQREWTLEYVRSHGFDEDEVQVIQKMENWRITNTISAMSRMINRGIEFPPEMMADHDRRIRDEVEAWRRHHQVESTDSVAIDGPRRSRANVIVESLIADVEEMLDEFSSTGLETVFSVKDFLKKKQVNASQARAIADKYRPVLDELTDMDPETREGVRLTDRQINTLVLQLGTIIRETEDHARGQKKTPVKRARKVDPDRVARNTRFMTAYEPLQLIGLKPREIVGARGVYLYHTKYNQLKYLAAATDEGLTLSGSTVKNFDAERSRAQALKNKAGLVLRKVMTGTKLTLPRVFDDLTSKVQIPNGRIGDDTVIVRVV